MMMILHHSFGDIDVIDCGGGGYGDVAVDGGDFSEGIFVVMVVAWILVMVVVLALLLVVVILVVGCFCCSW